MTERLWARLASAATSAQDAQCRQSRSGHGEIGPTDETAMMKRTAYLSLVNIETESKICVWRLVKLRMRIVAIRECRPSTDRASDLRSSRGS